MRVVLGGAFCLEDLGAQAVALCRQPFRSQLPREGQSLRSRQGLQHPARGGGEDAVPALPNERAGCRVGGSLALVGESDGDINREGTRMLAAPSPSMTTAWIPLTPAEVETKIQEMVRRIVEGFHPEKIILFGSHAHGNAGPDSDVDLLIVTPTSSKRDTTRAIGVALHGMGLPKDIVVVTPDEFERRKNIVGTLAYPAHHEGRILWTRTGQR